jgi:alpha-1,3-rhamnosyl/mannosyltransferase
VSEVGINLLWMVPDVAGGSETSTTETLRALARVADPDIRYTVFALAPYTAAHPDLVDAFETITMPLSGRAKGLRVVGESTWLARQVRRRRLELVHHAGGTVPPLRTAPSIVTIHDLQPFDHPEHFHPIKRTYLHIAVPRSARAAALILTPSEFVRRSVIDTLGIAPGRVVAILHGASTPRPGTSVEEVRARYRLPGPWFLYPVITYPHKNHRVLVEAFAAVARAHPDATLVLTGGAAGAEDALSASIERLGLGARVRRPGRIPEADLHGLYDGATGLAFPSTYEGFGLPVLEAMARGCAVLAADATALPEVVGSGGTLLPPDDVPAWSKAMIELIDRPEERQRLAAAGLARAAELTWDRTGRAVGAAHHRVLAELAP